MDYSIVNMSQLNTDFSGAEIANVPDWKDNGRHVSSIVLNIFLSFFNPSLRGFLF